MNRYTKLKEGWGIRLAGTAQAGQTVTVTTKAGPTKSKTVAKVIWTDPDKFGAGQISLCTIVQKAARKQHGTYAPGGAKCPQCESRECEGAWGGLCDED
jgi:hypothetical protein